MITRSQLMTAKEAAGEVTLRQERVNDHPHPARHNSSRYPIGTAGATAAEFHSGVRMCRYKTNSHRRLLQTYRRM